VSCGRLQTSTELPFGKDPCVSIEKEVGWAPKPVQRGNNLLPLLGIEPRNFDLLAHQRSHYSEGGSPASRCAIASYLFLFLCLSVYLYICLSVCLCVCVSVYLSIHLSMPFRSSVRLSAYLSLCLCFYPSVHPSIHLSNPHFCLSLCPCVRPSSIYMSVYPPSVCPSVLHLYVRLSVCSSIHLFVHPPVCPSLCLLFFLSLRQCHLLRVLLYNLIQI
jgi:hypothetical protein